MKSTEIIGDLGRKPNKVGKIRYAKSKAVKELEAMAYHAARAKYPTVPYLAPRTFRDDTANGLTKCIISFLKLEGWQAERIANMGRTVDHRLTFTDVLGNRRTIGSTTWIPGTGTNGTGDISATIQGRSVKIEVKAGKDRQSDHQLEYQRQVEAAGGIYVIARDFAGFNEWYNQNFSS